MRLECFGAVKGVTGSCYLIDGKLLIDCGMFQGIKEDEDGNYGKFGFDPKNIVGAVLTHPHLDHCGLFPKLFMHGFNGNVYMTPATKELATLILKDHAKVFQRNGKKPMYNPRILDKAISRFNTIAFDEPFELDNYIVKLRRSGHMLGAASVEINEKGRKYPTVLFTGDLGVSYDYKKVEADIVVMESTYGDRNHPTEDPHDVVQEVVNQVEWQQKGTVVIAAFAVERTQTVLSTMRNLKLSGLVGHSTPVLLDTPMGIEATNITRRYINNFEEGPEPYNDYFRFPGLTEATDFRQSQKFRSIKKPHVVISSSGMFNGGRILDHAFNLLPDSDSIFLVTGYQGEGTLGRELIEGAREVVIEGVPVQVNATIRSTGAFSSHADQNHIMKTLHYLSVNNPRNLTQIYLTHGGRIQKDALANRIRDELYIEAIQPELKHEYVF